MSFDNSAYTTSEQLEQDRPNLVFSNPSSFDITVQVMTSDITATGVNDTECVDLSPDNDYTMGIYDVTFTTMMIMSSISIPVCNDIVLEENEMFRLTIVSDSLHVNVTIGAISQAEVAIMDNDRKLMQ